MSTKQRKRTAAASLVDAAVGESAASSDSTFGEQLHRGAAKPILVLRLAHSGSSWFTQMLSEQNDTFIARKGIYSFQGEDAELVRKRSVDQLTQYALQALSVPVGNIVRPGYPQLESYGCLNATAALKASNGFAQGSLVSHEQRTANPAVTKCIHELHQDCP